MRCRTVRPKQNAYCQCEARIINCAYQYRCCVVAVVVVVIVGVVATAKAARIWPKPKPKVGCVLSQADPWPSAAAH